MSILDRIKIMRYEPPRITIYGVPGIGKSTLASQFPDPLFITIEKNGLTNVKCIEVEPSFADAWSVMIGLIKEENLPFKTIIIDSISELDKLVVQYVLDNEMPKKSGKKPQTLAQCGFNHGYERAASVHGGFKNMCDMLVAKGLAIIFLAHQEITKYKSPDEEDYDIYSLQMNHTKSRSNYITNVDAVFQCKLKSFTDTNETGRTIVRSTDERVIVAGLNAGNVSKNRFNIPNEIPMSFEELKKYIPYYNQEQ